MMPSRQAHAAVHVEAEIGDERGAGLAESVDEFGGDVIGEGVGGVAMPERRDAFEGERGVFTLHFVFEFEVQCVGLARLAVAEDCAGFARVVVGVMEEEDDFSADF